jgi:hypothetical protein
MAAFIAPSRTELPQPAEPATQTTSPQHEVAELDLGGRGAPEESQ